MNMPAADDSLKIICALLVIAVIYCLVEMVRYWYRRNTHTHAYKKSHHPHQHLNEQENEKRAEAIEDILKHESSYVDLKQPPPNEDCPICFLPLPSMTTGRKYKSCCGKIICSGCTHAVEMMDDDAKCPFCRVPTPESDEEIIEMNMKRMEMEDAEAIYNLGCYYHNGEFGLPSDRAKALELLHRSGELGNAIAYYCIGAIYDCDDFGRGEERLMKKAKHYYELAAIGGDLKASCKLGILEGRAGNMIIALKHYMIAVGCGDNLSLKQIKEFYKNGYATKDDYAKALQLYQKYLDEIKSAQRDEAAAYDSDEYRYY